MTNEEAIKTLKANYPDACFEQLREAVDAAIKALEALEQLSKNSPELYKGNGELISRQAAIDVIDKIFPADPMRNDYTQGITCGAALATEYIKQLPSAQPETHEERTETHACDCISRQAAIDALRTCYDTETVTMDDGDEYINYGDAIGEIEQLPSAQPEIVRCGSCKYAEIADARDNQDGYTCQFHRGSIWFSGSYCSWAERRTDG